MAIWALAKKELRLLLRDRLAAGLLVGMPLLFILILGLLLGEGFGQKPDERLRISLVDLDRGLPADTMGHLPSPLRQAHLAAQALGAQGVAPAGVPLGPPLQALAAAELAFALPFPYRRWSEVVQEDLAQTAGIRVEIIPDRAEAERLCRDGKRAAVLVFAPNFSERVAQCSFLKEGINPFYRDGVRLSAVGAELVTDPTQLAASSIIEQVAQVTLIRVILPYMIGRAFEKLGEPAFMSMLADRVPGGKFLPREIKEKLGSGVQQSLKDLFPRYELTGKTWAALTKAEPRAGEGAGITVYADEDGTGFLHRGALRYQVLVPAYTVMFAFSLVLTVGWLFAAERRQGTMKRLRAAPVGRSSVLLGKLLPCFAVSLSQGLFLLGAGKIVFGMRWGPDAWTPAEQLSRLLPVVAATSFAAMGLALLLAAVARTEMQVALGGTLVVLVLALVSGCLIPRELMPEQTQRLALLTPHGWALAAYRQLLLSPDPNLTTIHEAVGVLAGFGAGFLALAWSLLRLD